MNSLRRRLASFRTFVSVLAATTLINSCQSDQTGLINPDSPAPAHALTGASINSLTVNILRMPWGLDANVLVTGPAGFYRELGESQTLSDLVPGAYTIAATSVASGGYIYAPTDSVQLVNLTGDAPATATVTYAVLPSPLTVTIAGLPDTIGGDITVTGPGFSDKLTATRTYNGLSGGSYSVTATPVTSGGITYTPATITQLADVGPGIMAAVVVMYSPAGSPAPSTGSATITLTGVPNSASANVIISGPAGFTYSLTTTQTLTGLAPGTYTIAASAITVGGFAYAPALASQSLLVEAGTAAAAAVMYSAADGDLNVAITGLPAGGQADVTLTGPGGYARTLNGTQLLTALSTGSYTAVAANVTVGGVTYMPATAAQTQNVTAGATTSISISYAPVASSGTGALAVTVMGVPSGLYAEVTVTGPGGYSHVLSETETLSGLLSGTYSVTAANFSSGGYTYAPSSPSQVVTVGVAGSSPGVTLMYRPLPSPLTVTITGLPATVDGDVTVTGPGFFHQLLATRTYHGLSGGAYTVTAAAVTSGGVTYVPSAVAQVADVGPGIMAAATVMYSPAGAPAPLTGATTITISGLPIGANANVTVTGPAGFAQTLAATQTLTGLTPGAYTITAGVITVGGFGYAPTIGNQSFTITAGSVTSAGVTFAPADGDLSVTVSGLPGGSSAAVTVTGPGGYSHIVTSAQLLTAVATGSYTITAANVVVAGVTYAPSTLTQTQNVTAGTTASVNVGYAAIVSATGALSVTVKGVPSGLDANVTVTGPGGFSQSLSGTQTLSGLAAGTYSVVATSFSSNGYTYAPSPATQFVTVGGAGGTNANVLLMYGALPSPLTITVTGLPANASADITVTGPGFTQQPTATRTYNGLVGGPYTVAAAAVTSDGITYMPSVATQVADVGPGIMAIATVAYTANTPPPPAAGAATITIGGMPIGANANVTVAGPAGFSQALTATQTLNGLAPGTYTITASPVLVAGFGYAPTIGSQSIVVAAGAATSAGVTYAPADGDLSIVISGLPAGSSGAVSVTGPGGYSHSVTSSQLLTALATGTYTVTAADVAIAGVTYTVSTLSQTPNVTAGATATANISYVAVVPVTGALTVTVKGVPSGVPANVTIIGPNAFAQGITATQTFSTVVTGDYTITAGNISTGGYTYAPSTITQTATVAGGSAASTMIVYTALPSPLTVTITGLPASVGGDITVTGPGFSQQTTATRTYYGLSGGAYTVAAAAVTSGGITYTPSVVTQVADVGPGIMANATVAYSASAPPAPTTGAATITISGLPIGANASVTISGPAGFAQALISTQTLTGLTPGTYTLTANPVNAGGFTFGPSATSQSLIVAAGSSAAGSVTYAPADGDLSITINGLPAGVSALATVTGPGGLSQTIGSSQLLTALSAGTYTITSANVTSGGATYAPSVTSQTKVVAAGSTVSATVTYAIVAPVTGSLGVSIAGLPAGVSGNVTVTGPGGFSLTLTNTQTLTNLTPGSYTITAANVTSAGVNYTGSPATQASTVTSGSTASATVTYAAVAPTTGAMKLTINGLPAGVNASVSVTGPGGFAQGVIATQTLNALAVGTYTINAANVTSGGVTYTASPSSQTRSVVAGATADVGVTYTAVAPITGLTLTVSGLPAGVNGNVTVTSLLGVTQLLTATQTLSGLTVGVYTITAQNVTSGGVTYVPSPSSQTALVVAGLTVANTVTYAPQGLGALSPGFHARTLTLSAAQAGGTAQTFNYQIYVPAGYTPSTAWPIILTSSGSGEFGTNNTAQLGVGLGPHLDALAERAIVVFPQWHSVGGAPANLRAVLETSELRATMAEVRTDSTRVYGTGNSSGGFQVWANLYYAPSLFAGIVSAAGGINITASGASSVTAEVDALLTTPIWSFAADDDGTVPYQTYFTPIVTEWTAKGSLTLHHATLYHAIGGHGPTWDTAFADPATWTWLFAQHK